MITKQQVEKALKNVEDPEIRMDIVTLGLIYSIDIKKDIVNIRMTLTTPMCPYGPFLIESVKSKVKDLGAKDVNVDVTFDPPWQPPDELRSFLGL